MKFVTSLFLITLMSACSGGPKQERPIFSISNNDPFSVEGASHLKGGVLWIQDSSDTQNPPVLQLNGSWDFTGSDHLKVVLINANGPENINAVFRMEGDGNGTFQAKKSIRAKDTVTWYVPLPKLPGNPEILDDLHGMRATPLRVDGVTSDMDLSNVGKISVSFDKWLKGTKLGIQEISSIHGEPVNSPKWFTMAHGDFFPFIDSFGQFIHKDWPGKTKDDNDLLIDLQDELAFMEKHPGPDDRSRYGGWSKGAPQIAKGHFYVDKIDGKWWMVDPDGHLFWSHGVVRVTPSSAVTIIDDREHFFEALPAADQPLGKFYQTKDEFMYRYYKSWDVERTYDFSSANIYKKYGDNWRGEYGEMVGARLRNWGMNTISAGSDPNIYRKLEVPYSDRIELNSPRIAGAPDHLNVIRDPFHHEFKQKFREQLLERKQELESPWCYGYFVDNKLVWGADHDLGRWVLKSPGTQPAKIAFIRHLKNKYGTISDLNSVWKTSFGDWDELLAEQDGPFNNALGDCMEFSAILIEEYFKKVASTMEGTAPGKLNLGCRYVTVNERVLHIAAKYSDVLTFDLFWDSLSGFQLPKGIDKPVLIGEFHFGATDRGLFHPGLNPRPDQRERGLAYEEYVRSALKNPLVVGTAWHQFSDQATTGRFDGENFQDGLTDVCDHVYWETVKKVKEVGSNLYPIRNGLK